MVKLVSDKLYGTHPEYFALIHGKRERQIRPGQGVTQPCTSHPDVIRLAAEGVRAKLCEDPPGGIYSMNNNDGNGWCQCARCRALDPPDERKRSRVSTRFYTFINAVARGVYNERPDAMLWSWAYQAFQLPPTGVRPDPRLRLMVALHGRCYRHSIGDPRCEANQKIRDLLKGWARFGNRMGTYDYYCGVADWRGSDDTLQYVPLEHVAAQDIRYLHRLGCRAWRVEVPPPDGKFGPAWNNLRTKENWRANLRLYYVMAKLLWNPKHDVDRLLSELNEKFYGPAAGAMAQYRALLRDRWHQTPGHFIYGSPYNAIGKCLASPGAEKRLVDDLAEADRAAKGQATYLKRIAKDKQYFQLCWRRTYARYQTRPMAEICIARTSAPIQIDGVLDEAAWRGCDYVTGFVRAGGQVVANQTFVRMLYDSKYVYIAVEADEPAVDKLKIHRRARDSEVWKDDDIELFIDPAGAGVRYFHFAINPAGAMYDADCKLSAPYDVDFNADVKVAAKALKKTWAVELRISAASLGTTIRDGARWKMNVSRARRAGGVREYSSWADGTFHQVDSFRSVVFATPLVRNGGFEDVLDLNTPALLKRFGREGWQYGHAPARHPRGWNLHGGHPGTSTVVDRGAHCGRRAWQVENGWVQQRLSGALEPNTRLRIQLWARGTGTVTVAIYHYRKNADGALRFDKTTVAGKVSAGAKWKRHELVYTHPAGHPPFASLALWVKGAVVLDDVYVTTGR